MKSSDLAINISPNQNDNQSLISKSISRQLNRNASLTSRSITNSICSAKQNPEIRVYKRRFLMIILSLFLCISNAYQWIQFSSVTDKLTLYYSISNLQVNLLSIIYFCVYVSCIIFATKIIELKGLRYSIILAGFLNFLGALIKCGSLNQEFGYYVALLGQFFSALACLLIFNIPPEIATTWFSSEEVSRVVSLEVCSCFIGNSIAFFVPVLLVGHLTKAEDIAFGFSKLYFGAMILNGLVLILIIFLFEEKPPQPPSLSQFYRLNEIKGREVKETTSIKSLLQNRNLVIFIIYSSINAGVFDALATLLNQMILIEFPGNNNLVGSIGIIFILSGMIGSLVCGYLLDKLHKYKEISIMFYGSSIVFLILFMFKLHFSSASALNDRLGELADESSSNFMLHVYVFGLAFWLIGYWTIRFDFGPELAYPSSSATVCGLTAACCDIAGIIITILTSKIVDNYGTLSANILLAALLTFGMCLLLTIKPEYKRQAANAKKPLINNSLNIYNNNNQTPNSNYGTLEKWQQSINEQQQLSKTPLINSTQSCRIEYTNMCFQFPASNPMTAN